jgi:hypothetical protein
MAKQFNFHPPFVLAIPFALFLEGPVTFFALAAC